MSKAIKSIFLKAEKLNKPKSSFHFSLSPLDSITLNGSERQEEAARRRKHLQNKKEKISGIVVHRMQLTRDHQQVVVNIIHEKESQSAVCSSCFNWVFCCHLCTNRQRSARKVNEPQRSLFISSLFFV